MLPGRYENGNAAQRVRHGRLRAKRAIDFVVAGSMLLGSSPLLALLALAIRFSMGRPILFKQPRIGHRGEVFTLLKFRTMEESVANGQLLPDEDRLTPLGKVLRQTSLDELPELVNVIKGEMSIVGPRPLLVEYRDVYSPRQWRRHEVRPGLVGPVTAYGRNALSWEEKFELDLWYVDNWSLWMDMKLLLRSGWMAVRRRGISATGHVTMPKFGGLRGDEDE